MIESLFFKQKKEKIIRKCGYLLVFYGNLPIFSFGAVWTASTFTHVVTYSFGVLVLYAYFSVSILCYLTLLLAYFLYLLDSCILLVKMWKNVIILATANYNASLYSTF